VAVLVLILVLPERPDIVAAAWGILAVGDGMATIVGRRAALRIPWNGEKSVPGLHRSCSLAVPRGSSSVVVRAGCRASGLRVVLAAGPIVAAVAAGLVETIPIRLDDNLSVPFAAAAVLWWLSLVSQDGGHVGLEPCVGLCSWPRE